MDHPLQIKSSLSNNQLFLRELLINQAQKVNSKKQKTLFNKKKI